MNKFSLRSISFILVALLLSVALSFGYFTTILTKDVSDINNSWLSFKAQNNEKSRLINSLYETLGYGGMIHNIKNYILRRDIESFVKSQQSLGAAQTVVNQYYALSTTPVEKLVINDIQSMIENYQKALYSIRENIEEKKTAEDIDELVKIDDSFALRGMTVLYGEISEQYDYFKNESNKPVLAHQLHVYFGYGGMIHSYKNYVLRNDAKYKQSALESIEKLEDIIGNYYSLGTSSGEKTALEDISSVLQKYKNNVFIIEKGITDQLTPTDIDRLVKIDDNFALRGLTTIDQDIINQIEIRSDLLSKNIFDVRERAFLFGALVVVGTIIIALYLSLVLFKEVIGPIKKISKDMLNMAAGNLDLHIDFAHPVGPNTEIGKMHLALDTFRSNELRRRDAEQEITKLAMSDPLTGLANRNEFLKRSIEIAALCKREEKNIALFAIDLDRFKPINDDYGHAAGDLILKAVAKNLKIIFRETDLVCRIGGDEFSVIIYGFNNVEELKNIAGRLIKLMPSPVPFGKDMLSVGCSVGIAIHNHGDEFNLDALVVDSDNALYEAKESGRNDFRIFCSEKAQQDSTKGKE